MPHLFEPLTLRSITLDNRLVVSPMCQYSSEDGFATDWHLVHLGSRAVGGAGLVFTEATAITAAGRISPEDLGIYRDEHVPMLARIVQFIHGQRTHAGIQLAHAGRKASVRRPWDPPGAAGPSEGGWGPIGPTSRPFTDSYPVPRAMTPADIAETLDAYRQAARRALAAGFDVIELHAAHGYLLHEFLSPLVNDRVDGYGGSFDNRVRFCLEAAEAIRDVWAERLVLTVRISATDWIEGGWDLEQSIELARRLRVRGVDLVDCSSGGLMPNVNIPLEPAYQAPFAERIRREAGIATGAVGLITEPAQADEIIRLGRADVVLMARQLLRDPYFPLRAARELDQTISWPPQYLRAAPHGSPARPLDPPGRVNLV